MFLKDIQKEKKKNKKVAHSVFLSVLRGGKKEEWRPSRVHCNAGLPNSFPELYLLPRQLGGESAPSLSSSLNM